MERLPHLWHVCNHFGTIATTMTRWPLVWNVCHKNYATFVTTMEHLPHLWHVCDSYGTFATTMEHLPQLWNVRHNYGTLSTTMASLPQLWSVYHTSDTCATTMDRMPQLWNVCHNYGTFVTTMERFPQLWQVCHNYGMSQKLCNFSHNFDTFLKKCFSAVFAVHLIWIVIKEGILFLYSKVYGTLCCHFVPEIVVYCIAKARLVSPIKVAEIYLHNKVLRLFFRLWKGLWKNG